jgi:acyl-[acyl-carrier-protein]-phospholipid O-acyltransferase/long-chain-fatty-acid--[acyl-carrier-protein] ligase
MNPQHPQQKSDARQTIDLPAENGHEGLLSASFLGLLITQFLGAMNDNIFRWLVAWIGGDLAVNDPLFCRLVGQLGTDKYKEIAVSAGLATLVLPFIFLAAPAGYFADRFSKRTVIVGAKVAEVACMLLGTAVILYGNVWLMFFTLFLMGSQSAIFGPSKYGSIPEIVRPDRIPAANGLIAMSTILAIVLGSVSAGFLYEWTKPFGRTDWWLWSATIVGVALVGCLTSLPIRRLKIADPARQFHWNFARQSWSDLGKLAAIRAILWAAIGSALFWSLGGLCQINVDGFGAGHLGLTKQFIGPLLGILALGVGAGSILAGVISRGKIQLGLVPLGAAGIAISHFLLYFVPASSGSHLSFSYIMTAGCLLLLGFSGGLYDVPLQSFLQYRSPEQARGSIFAATNLLTFTGTLFASGLFIFLTSVLGLSNRTVFLLVGAAILPLLIVLIRFTAYDSTRIVVVALWRLMYRTRIEGLENIPASGALITPNHVSWADGLLVGLACPRDPRMLAIADYFENPWLGWFGRLSRVIPIKPGRKSIIESLRIARESLLKGDLVCVFPEGGITRTGEMQPFQPGVMAIIKGTDIPIIPTYVEGMWGSIFSYEGGRFFWKLPKKWRSPVTIRFGKPIYHPTDIEQIRQAVLELGKKKDEG